MPATAISVVVMDYRNAAVIVRAVTSVVEQRAPERFDLVVVTSGGDDSARLVRSRFPDVPIVDSPTRLLPGGARNAGIAATTGRYVAFLAADCVAAPGWLAGRLAAHQRGRGVVASAIANGERKSLAAWAQHFVLYARRQAGRGAGYVSDSDPAAHGLSFDRRLLEDIGPFDDRVRIGEDTDMARRVAAVGERIWFEPTVVTVHFPPRSAAGMVRDRRRRVRNWPAANGPSVSAYGPGMRGVWRAWRHQLSDAVTIGWRFGGPDRRRVPSSLPWMALSTWAAVVEAHRFRRDGESKRTAQPPTAPDESRTTQ